jgi:uncharacterized protein (UPF0333 family)
MNKQAQSTLEYILVLVVVLMAVIYAVANPTISPVRKGLTKFFNELGTGIGNIMVIASQ